MSALAATGEAFQWAALAALLIALALQAFWLRWGRASLAGPSRVAGAAAAVLTTLALLVLVTAFLAKRIDIEYVHLYTRTDYSVWYRLVGVWGAQKGTLLLWAAMISWMVAWLLWRTRPPQRAAAAQEAPGDDDTRLTLEWTRFFVQVVLLGFLWLVVRQDTFAATPARLLESRPLGNGLNPVLLNPYILVHPPAEFLGYALATIPAAAALAYLATGRANWSAAIAGESRVAWLGYTLALVLGALWAYTTLSFGGYWAWDPVEVANLIPWLLLGAFLHARLHNERHGAFPVAAPALAIATLAFTIGQTIATRSGLWISVHAFTDPTGTFARDPYLRFANILMVEPSVAAITGLLGALVLLALALASRRAVGHGPLRHHATACLVLAGATAAAPATAIPLALELASHIGNTTVGLLLMALVLVLPPVVARWRQSAPDAAEVEAAATRQADPLGRRSLVGLAVALLASGTGVITLFMLRGVNGLNRAVFDDWAPVLILPVVLLMVPAFGRGMLRRRTQIRIMVAGASGVLVTTFVSPWQITLLAPALAVALGVGLLRIGLLLAPPNLEPRQRLAIACLAVAGLAGLLHWSSPPSWLAGVALPTGLLPQAVGLAGSAFVLVAAGLAGRGRNPAIIATAALVAIATIGYGLAVAAGAIALALTLAPGRARVASPGAAGALARGRPALRPFGVHLIHLGLLVLIGGYAASTYASTEADGLLLGAAGPDSADDLGSWHLAFASAEAASAPDATDGGADWITVQVDASRNGEHVGTSRVRFHWVEQVQHYDPETHVVSIGGYDLYLAGLAFCRDPSGGCAGDDAWVGAHEDGVGRIPAGQPITAVVLDAKVLPLASLLWGGVNAMMLGITLVALPSRRPAPAASSTRVPTSRPLTAGQPSGGVVQAARGSVRRASQTSQTSPTSRARRTSRAEIERRIEAELAAAASVNGLANGPATAPAALRAAGAADEPAF